MEDMSDGPIGQGGARLQTLSADRRASPRRKVSRLCGSVRVNGVGHALEVTDISTEGLQGETDVAVHAGQPVEIVLPEVGVVRGTVRWGVGPYVGVKFDQAIALPDQIG